MQDTMNAICIGAAAFLLLVVVVGMILSWHIGGFFRTIEREAREEEERRGQAAEASNQKPSGE